MPSQDSNQLFSAKVGQTAFNQLQREGDSLVCTHIGLTSQHHLMARTNTSTLKKLTNP